MQASSCSRLPAGLSLTHTFHISAKLTDRLEVPHTALQLLFAPRTLQRLRLFFLAPQDALEAAEASGVWRHEWQLRPLPATPPLLSKQLAHVVMCRAVVR